MVSDEDPEGGRARLVGLRVAVGPLTETFAVRATVPEKAASDATVIVDVPDEPGLGKRYVGLADTPKLGTPVMLPMNVDQQLSPKPQFPVARLWYSPATHAIVVSEGSTAAPKKSPYRPLVSLAEPCLRT